MTFVRTVRRTAALAFAAGGLLLAGLPAAGHAAEAAGAVRPLWTRFGIGMVADLAVADLGGSVGLVAAGRGVGGIGPRTRLDGRFVWTNKWRGSHTADDSRVALETRVADVTGDGVDDAIVASGEAVYAMDGVTGRTIWRAIDEQGGTSPGAWWLTTADLDRDGIQDVAFANIVDDRITAVNGKDGTFLWSYPKDGIVLDLAAGDLDLDGHPDVVVIGQTGGADFEVQAIDGDVQGTSATALWEQHFPYPRGAGDPTVVVIGQVDVASPEPEVVVGGSEGKLSIMAGSTGASVGFSRVQGGVADMVLTNVDSDPDLEIVVAQDRTFDGSNGAVDAIDGDGTALWRLETSGPAHDLQTANLRAGGADEVLVAGGWQDTPPGGQSPGFVAALDPTLPRLAWSEPLPEWGSRVVYGPVFGDPTVAVSGGQEGGVWGFDPRGRSRWFVRTGGRVERVLAADLDGGGIPEVIEGADDSTVAVSDANGVLRWAQRVPGGFGPDVISVAAANLLPSPGLEVLAGTIEFDLSGPGGRIHAYSKDGTRLWSADALGWVDSLQVADVDGDGSNDVVAATSTDGSVARLDAGGHKVWETPLDTGLHASLALADANGDGTLDALVATKRFFDGDLYAVDGATGDVLWHDLLAPGLNWVSVTSDPADGAVAGDLAGTVFRFDLSDGSQVWASNPPGSSWDGHWSVDANADGVRDVFSVYEDGNARMLDGTNGKELWASRSNGQPGFSAVTLPGSRPQVAMGTLSTDPDTFIGIYVFDALTGQRIGTAQAFGSVLDLAAANLDGDRAQELLAGAGWEVHALDVRS